MNTEIKGYLQSEAKCPHCHKELLRIPKRKSRCPFCNKVFYVRRPMNSKNRYIVTGTDSLKIDDEWETKSENRAISSSSTTDKLIQNELCSDYRDMVRVAHGYRNRDYFDEALSCIQRAKSEAILAGNYLACLEILRDMAEILMLSRKHLQAIAVYCEYNYLCLCGVDDIKNVNELVDLGIIDSKYYGTPWNPEKIGLSDTDMYSLDSMAQALKIKRETLVSIVNDVCNNIFGEYNCPLSPAEVLPDLISLVDGTSGIHANRLEL
jgi:hypothetical protein